MEEKLQIAIRTPSRFNFHTVHVSRSHASPHGDHGDVANALVVLSLSPHKLARTLVQLTEMELALVRPQMHEHVRRRAKLSGPVGSLMSVVVGRGVLHWHAVQQVILNLVIQSDSEGDTDDEAF